MIKSKVKDPASLLKSINISEEPVDAEELSRMRAQNSELSKQVKLGQQREKQLRVEVQQEKLKRRKSELQTGTVKQKFTEMRAFQSSVNKFMSHSTHFQTAASVCTAQSKTTPESEEQVPVFLRAVGAQVKENAEDTMQDLFGSANSDLHEAFFQRHKP